MKFWNRLAAVFAFSTMLSLSGASLKLAENGKTDYVIVPPANPVPMEELAVRELQEGLKKVTGADFKTGSNGARRIVLARDSGLAPEECSLAIQGKDLVLKGGDRFGVVYAVYTFLEDQLGIRWFTRWGDCKYPKTDLLQVDFKEYRRKPAYHERTILMSSSFRTGATTPFYFRNRLNFSGMLTNGRYFPGTDSAFKERGHSCHTVFFYIPTKKGAHPQLLKFKQEKYYFAEHPEYFSMDRNGNRCIHMQLCFSNPGLRKEFKRRLYEMLETSGWKDGVVSISAEDCPGKFCYCPGCTKLEKKYRTPAGPLVDFLLELCPEVKKKYPHLFISTLAYRLDQSELPPFLNGGRMPDNFICVFAPIDTDFSKPLDHPNNLKTLRNLKGWAAISRYVWMWYYPLPYGGTLPFISLERNARDIRLMHEAGATGSYFEHDVGVWDGCNFSDLLTWLYLKLIQNPDADYRALVAEYCDFAFGAASGDMQKYLYELEKCTQACKVHWIWNGGAVPAALEPENLLRWSKLFDRMEKETAGDPAALARVRDVRFMLDIATLHRYRKITRGRTDVLPSPEVMKERIQKNIQSALDRRMTGNLASLKKARKARYTRQIRDAYLYAVMEPKKLDAPLDKIAPEKIRQVIPARVNKCGIMKMADAAFGEAIYHPAKGLEMPFTCGFYDEISKKFLLSRSISAEEIVPDKFHLYRIGSAPIGQSGYIWTMSNWKVGISCKGLYTPGESLNKKYDIWLSIKFEGPGYNRKSKAKTDRFYIDRAVIVDPD